MRSLTLIAASITAALAVGCASSSHVAVRATDDAGYRDAQVIRQAIDQPTNLGCNSDDSVAYRLKAVKPNEQADTYVTVCCGPKRLRCEVIDAIGDF